MFPDIPKFNRSLIEEHLGCLQVLINIGKAVINICVKILNGHRFQLLWVLRIVLRSTIAGLYGKSIFSFETTTVFQSIYTSLHSYQQCMRVSVAVHPFQYWVLSVFWILVILIGKKWYLIVVLICISLMTSSHMLIYYLPFFIHEVSLKVFVQLFNQLFFLLLSFKNSFRILNNDPLSEMSLANIFLQYLYNIFLYKSMACLFILLIMFFTKQKLLKF